MNKALRHKQAWDIFSCASNLLVLSQPSLLRPDSGDYHVTVWACGKRIFRQHPFNMINNHRSNHNSGILGRVVQS
ncbi:MAG: hypothetical protein ABL861_05750 [Nitrosomonas sp.]